MTLHSSTRSSSKRAEIMRLCSSHRCLTHLNINTSNTLCVLGLLAKDLLKLAVTLRMAVFRVLPNTHLSKIRDDTTLLALRGHMLHKTTPTKSRRRRPASLTNQEPRHHSMSLALKYHRRTASDLRVKRTRHRGRRRRTNHLLPAILTNQGRSTPPLPLNSTSPMANLLVPPPPLAALVGDPKAPTVPKSLPHQSTTPLFNPTTLSPHRHGPAPSIHPMSSLTRRLRTTTHPHLLAGMLANPTTKGTTPQLPLTKDHPLCHLASRLMRA